VNYPRNWPRCVYCGHHALDGHLTCGRGCCSELKARNDRAGQYAASQTAALPQTAKPVDEEELFFTPTELSANVKKTEDDEAN